MEQAGGASGVRSVKGRRQGSERELEAVGRKNNATVSALALTVPRQSSPALPCSLALGRLRSLPTVMVPHDAMVSAFSCGFSGGATLFIREPALYSRARFARACVRVDCATGRT